MFRPMLLLPLSFFLFAFTGVKKPLRVIFFGDSITEAGLQPDGYISQLHTMLADRSPTPEMELVGSGIGGNKVYDLFLRLEPDVLSQNPDVVVIYVGVNDVWHKRSFGTGTDPDKFERFYAALIEKMQAQNIRTILCTPACIGERPDCTNMLDGELNYYSEIIRRLAVRYNSDLCDLRRAFLNYQAENNPANQDSGILTTDGVHLNTAGNQMVARLLLEKLEK
jgi:lysophospholipase L1-like esterase